MSLKILREVTPLTSSDCFMLFSREKSCFDFPLHYHEEFELNLILNAPGAQRIVGDHIEEIGNLELVLVGPNQHHGWFDHRCKSTCITELTIQFQKDLFNEELLRKNQLSFVRKMLEQSAKGIMFSTRTIAALKDRLLGLKYKTGFESVLELMAILHHLSQSDDMKILCNEGFHKETMPGFSRRIDSVFEFLNEHYSRPVTLAEVAARSNMHEASFSRFIKKRTGKTFVDSLNDIRLGHASRLLIDTTQTVAEVAYNCGFNNISNFNRVFKRKKKCTPKEFRDRFSGARMYI